MNGDYYIDMSVDNSYDMLKNTASLNIVTKQNIYPVNEYNKDNKLIEGMGQFGRVNLQKCCPVNYMWSDKLKKCIKICDSCGVSAYGKINYEFLHNHDDEFFTFTTCEGDASGSYDYDKINKRYDKSELRNQYDMNIYAGQGVDSEVQAAEENPWDEFSSYLDPGRGTNPGTGTSDIEAEHIRRRTGFTQRLEILDKDMYYISSEITDIPEIITSNNNPWSSGRPIPGSWKMKNFSDWLSSEGKVSPIMHSLGTEFIPDKIIDPIDSTQNKTENIEYIQNLINEMDGDNEYGPVYHYYKDYLDIYSGDNSDNERIEILKGKREDFCNIINQDSHVWDGDPEGNPYGTFNDSYCGENKSDKWNEICQEVYTPPNEDDDDPPYNPKNLLCDTLQNLAGHTLTELCDVENLSPCTA